MVTSIARQSVIIKCSMGKSVLTGNYEFYYAAGVFCRLTEIEVDEDIKPLDLKKLLEEQIKEKAPQEEKDAYLFKLLSNYKPEEEYDVQMKELLLWGKNEPHLWSVTIPT